MVSIRNLIGNRNLLRDVIGILLALAAGISGQLFLSDPLNVLVPNLPLLSTESWPDSQVSVGLQILDGGSWSQKREIHQSLVRMQDGAPGVEVAQRLLWYADPTQPAAEWNGHFVDSYNGQELMARSLSKDRPLSLLFCSDVSQYPRECSYLAYWRHWYTEVRIRSRSEADLPVSERKELTDRIDQLLMSAPE